MNTHSSLRILSIYLALASLSVGFYLWVSGTTFRVGFPLDDAWIHQTYARNWVERGEWAFLPGQPSAGSTSPMWTAALALGYLLHVPHLIWTHFLGALLLAALGWVSYRWLMARNPRGIRWPACVGVLVLTEWHLIWSGLSGMETSAFALLAALLFWMMAAGGRWRLGAGLLVGLGLWLRPDAALLGLPVAWHLLWDRDHAGTPAIGSIAWIAAGIGIALIPYLAMNYALSGEAWPNTFYAKTAEYSSLGQISLPVRFLAQLGVPASWLGEMRLEPGGPLVGTLILLLPGILLSITRTVRQRDYAALGPVLWAGTHILAYAVRLPATYQHGRYAAPIIPVLVVLGAEGLMHWIDPSSPRVARRIVSRAWLALMAIISAIFWVMGARAYGKDVAIIETEMVETARWIEANTEPDSLVAAHDIGAVGYFGDRRLIDLAGLVSPEVIAFIRDEEAIGEYLYIRQTDYLMTFPGWYPQLTLGRTPVYRSPGSFSPAAGGEHMAVYRWQNPRFAP